MEETNIQWHLGVKPAVDLELAEERENLSYYREYSLNQQALEIDLLIIKKRRKNSRSGMKSAGCSGNIILLSTNRQRTS